MVAQTSPSANRKAAQSRKSRGTGSQRHWLVLWLDSSEIDLHLEMDDFSHEDLPSKCWVVSQRQSVERQSRGKSWRGRLCSYTFIGRADPTDGPKNAPGREPPVTKVTDPTWDRSWHNECPGCYYLGPVSTCHTARQQLSEFALTMPSGTSLAPLPGGLRRLRRHKRQFGSVVEQIAKRFALNSHFPLPTRLGVMEVWGILALLE